MSGGRGIAATLVVLLCTFTFISGEPLPDLAVDGDEIFRQLMHLATFTDDPNPAVTRVLFTEQDLNARGYVKQLIQEAGLVVREDAIGNIYGVLPGSDPSAPAVGTGSHCDAIPLAGAFDGTLGVIGGIAALRALREAGVVPRAPIEVVMFTSEEPTRFQLSCSGSRAMAGALTPADLAALRDANGSSYMEAAQTAGYGANSYEALLADARRTPADLGAFVELHIEQAPTLEAESLQIGVVTAIAAPAALALRFSGDGGHAGAHLMPLRNDASLAASEFALAVEGIVLATGSIDTVGTVGRWEISPNAVNSVPREAALEVDVRDVNATRRNEVVSAILAEAERIAAARKVRLTHRVISQDPPATSGPLVVETIAGVVEALGLSSKRMVSRAYHDTLFMAQASRRCAFSIAPTAMIFVPCRHGYSHRPDEYASPADIERGVRVLAHTLARLAGADSTVHTEL